MRLSDIDLMRQAIDAASSARTSTAPDPWVGSVIATVDGALHTAAASRPGGEHAEIRALRSAGGAAAGSTLVTTLEPCGHARDDTPDGARPCTDAIIEAGVARVVVGVSDPDSAVAGSSIAQLREAGVDVEVGVGAGEIAEQLAAYLHHRRTGRPYVVLRMAASADGRSAAPDGSSRWVNGDEARRDAHVLRSQSQAVLVGAGTVRVDDPTLTTRLVDGPDPRRVVLGSAPAGARVHPCLEWVGPLPDLLARLGGEGVVQLLVEGGAGVASEFHEAGLVDRYVIYLAPAMFGGDDARPLFVGAGAPTLADLRRGRFLGTRLVGSDLRIDLTLS